MPETEFGVVLEQRVRPRRTATVGAGRPRGSREVAAVDRRASGRVGDLQTIAEELRQELQIRRLAAARACARELEQGLRNCTPRTLAKSTRVRSAHGSVSKNAMLAIFLLKMFEPRLHVDGLDTVVVRLCAGQFSTHTPQPVQSST